MEEGSGQRTRGTTDSPRTRMDAQVSHEGWALRGRAPAPSPGGRVRLELLPLLCGPHLPQEGSHMEPRGKQPFCPQSPGPSGAPAESHRLPSCPHLPGAPAPRGACVPRMVLGLTCILVNSRHQPSRQDYCCHLLLQMRTLRPSELQCLAQSLSSCVEEPRPRPGLSKPSTCLSASRLHQSSLHPSPQRQTLGSIRQCKPPLAACFP